MKKQFRHKARVCAAVLLAGLTLFLTACTGNSRLKLASADQDGEYYRAAKELAKIIKGDAGLTVSVEETTGSAGNLRLLSNGDVQMAIVQSDVAERAYAAAPDSERVYSAIGGLYTEVCHIVVRADSDLYSVADFVGRRVSIGAEESGTESSALEILSAYGLTEQEATLTNLSYADASAALILGEIDALFCTGNVGMSVIKTLSRQTDIRLIPVSEDDLDQMNRVYNAYHINIIPAGTYTGQTEDIPAISVKAMLVVRNSVDEAAVKNITAAVSQKRTELVQTTYLAGDEALSYMTENIPIPFHAGAEAFFRENSDKNP